MSAALASWAREIDRHVERYAAVADDEHPVGERDRLGDVVGDEYRRETMLAPDALEQPVHLHTRQRIESAERLVEQQNARPAHQGAGERDALSLAAGQDRGPVVRPIGKPDIGERCRRSLAPAFRARDADIAENAMPGKQPRVLEQKPHVRLQRLDLGVADGNRSARSADRVPR